MPFGHLVQKRRVKRSPVSENEDIAVVKNCVSERKQKREKNVRANKREEKNIESKRKL